jgi:hypothetical protein
MHHIVLWKWKQENTRHAYNAEHVNTIARMLRRHIKTTEARVICITDDPAGVFDAKTYPLWNDAAHLTNASGQHLPSCYRRLRLYDPEAQRLLGIRAGDRIVSLDLDSLIVGNIDQILNTPGRFVGWELRAQYHPRVFNGSFQMFTAGDLAHIWNKFDPNRSPIEASDARFKGSDQAWLSFNLVKEPYGVGLTWPEVSSYPLSNRITGCVDYRTRIIFFHGSAKPWYPETFAASPWVQRHWNADKEPAGV